MVNEKWGDFLKISEFAKKNELSVDTIRYYMKENLITPTKQGSHYIFNEANQKEVNYLKKLKSYKFSLKEIKNLFLLNKFSVIKYLDTNAFLKNIYENKKKQLEAEITSLTNVKNDLAKEITSLSLPTAKRQCSMGLPLSFIEKLSCPLCNKNLILNTATIKNNSIQLGNSQCDCGFKLSISDGIIIPFTENVNVLEPIEDLSITNVLENSPSSFNEFMFSCINQLTLYLSKESLSQKIILDIKVGMGLLPLHLLNLNDSFKYFILLDDDINKLRATKESIESFHTNPNIIYICCDLDNLPLKHSTIDICIDFLGSFVNDFRLKENTYNTLLPYLKQHSIIAGLYLYFKKFDMLSRLPAHLRTHFDGKTLFNYLKSEGYNNKLAESETCLKEGSNVIGFFKPNDEVYASLRLYNR